MPLPIGKRLELQSFFGKHDKVIFKFPSKYFLFVDTCLLLYIEAERVTQHFQQC